MAHIHIVSHDYCNGLRMEWLIIYLCLLNAVLIEDLHNNKIIYSVNMRVIMMLEYCNLDMYNTRLIL